MSQFRLEVVPAWRIDGADHADGEYDALVQETILEVDPRPWLGEFYGMLHWWCADVEPRCDTYIWQIYVYETSHPNYKEGSVND